MRKPITFGGPSPTQLADTAEVTGISQASAVLRCTGDNLPGTIYAAVRTSGPYAPTDQTLVRNGTGATWYAKTDNAYSRSFMMENLLPATTYWYGTYRDTGSVTPVLSQSFTTPADPPEETVGKLAPLGDM